MTTVMDLYMSPEISVLIPDDDDNYDDLYNRM